MQGSIVVIKININISKSTHHYDEIFYKFSKKEQKTNQLSFFCKDTSWHMTY